jgi:quinohemoprotein ethanol dehydrogenase
MRGFVMALAALALAGCGAQGPDAGARVDAARLAAAEADGANWMSHGRTYGEQRFSPLDQINAGNVGTLGLAWHHEFETDRGHQATPIVVDGVMYVSTSWSHVHAFDAKSGERLWSYDPKVPGETAHKACCDVVNRGVAVWDGKVFVGALDGRLIALDSRTGKEVWSVVTVDQSKPYTITAAPRVVKGKVLIGNGGGEYGVRGYLSAYDAADGKLAWRFYMTPNPDGKPDGAASDKVLAEKARPTWSDGGAWKESGGGGTVWDSMAFDPELELLYVGVGNGSPWNHQIRSEGRGDNLFVSSILALRPETGEYVWHYQTTPGDTWDFTATQHIILADLTIDGQPRKVLMQAPKNGFFYTLDRATGALISAVPYIPMGPKPADAGPLAPFSWAAAVDPKTGRPIENEGARYAAQPALVMPGPIGGHNWHPMAFNPKEGLVYIPVHALPAAYGAQTDGYVQLAGAWNLGTNMLLSMLPDDEAQRTALKSMLRGHLVAWDPVRNAPRWTVEHPFHWNGGVLATAGDLVFQGTAEGRFVAYGAKDGKVLWETGVTNGIVAAPMTYSVDGDQYVAVMVGYGGAVIAAPFAAPDRPASLKGRLIVYKLGGTATAPPYVLPEKVKVDLAGVTSTGNVTTGMAAYHRHCQVCHGGNAVGGLLPDLRHSQMIRDAGGWKAVVHDGANASRGMVGFSPWLNETQVEDIRAYVLQETRRLQALPDAT